jgi:hypothetical protein
MGHHDHAGDTRGFAAVLGARSCLTARHRFLPPSWSRGRPAQANRLTPHLVTRTQLSCDNTLFQSDRTCVLIGLWIETVRRERGRTVRVRT